MDAERTRSATGWGYVEEGPSPAEVERAVGLLAARFPGADLSAEAPTSPAALPAPRLTVPAALAPWCTVDEGDRRLHAVGRSSVDVLAARRGQVTAPDVVARPRSAAEVAAVLDWCAEAGAVCVPFGGGTSVVGGVNPPGGGPVVTLQTRAMGRVLEVDHVSRAARIEAGAVGPDLEAQLRPSGLTLRFYPQSFELSTLGGWIATRAAGHYATRLVHIDDLVESLTAVTPVGLWSSRRLPSSGAGPSPDRLLLGSEGILGVITEAWVRVQERPRFRAGATVRFADLAASAATVRGLLQSGAQPANCRVLDPLEAVLNGVGDGTGAVLVLGFESASQPVEAEAGAALAACRDAGGTSTEGVVPAGPPGGARGGGGAGGGGARGGGRSEGADAWRRSFLRAPYLRDALLARGVLAETFETVTTWDRLDELVAAVTEATTAALREVCGDGLVTCRLTHAYPDGAAPYFTVLAPARRGGEAAQWVQVKAAASEAILSAGGSVTHHHAVGRDHRPWYDRQRPDPFALALSAAKRAVDPAALLNPGVLIP